MHELPKYLATFPETWSFARGDVYHWVPTLNRFDGILELFVKEYGLDQGPQTQPFELRILSKGDKDGRNTSIPENEIFTQGFSAEGDRELIESILRFSRILLEHCGNRSLYSSGPHLNNLLHSTSLSLVKSTLRLTLCLAIRYYSSRLRSMSSTFLNSLLSTHYSITLDRLQKIADPFSKKTSSSGETTETPSKGKDKSESISKATFNPAEFSTILTSKSVPEHIKSTLSSVQVTYYNSKSETSNIEDVHATRSPLPPVTPTPARRRSNLGQSSATRYEPSNSSEEFMNTTSKIPKSDTSSSAGSKTLRISSEDVASRPAWETLKEHLPNLPTEYHYGFLHKLRISKAFVQSKAAAEDVVLIRLLAIANLAYVYGESTFQQKIGQPDSEEQSQWQLSTLR